MNSLFDLNNFGQTTITITDARFATVLFDRMPPLQPLDQEQTITSTTVSIEPGIEITDIINYQTANVRYRVEIKSNNLNPLTGSTLSWPTLPAHLTISNVGQVYTITGFRTSADWSAARAFTWNLPAEYTEKPKWWLDSRIIYFDEELGEDVIKDWASYDLKYYEVAALQSTAQVDLTYKRIRRFASSLSATFSQVTDEGFRKQGRAFLSSQFTFIASALDAGLSASFTQTANVGRIRQFSFARQALFSQSANVTSYKAIVGMTNRSYTSNARNVIFTGFGQSAPYIEEALGSSSTYEVTLTSTSGQWSTTANDYTGSSSLTFTGTKDQVNAWFETVTWYPPKNVTSNVSVTYTQNKDGNLQVTKNFAFEHAANGTIPTNYYVINTVGSNTWQPTLVEKTYSQLMDYIVIGGGGGGASTNPGGGGGAGQYRTLTNQSILSSSYTAIVGAGGAKGGGSNSDGAVGGNSSFNGLVSVGGLGGISSALSRNANGGASGSGKAGGIGFAAGSGNDSGGGGGGQGGFALGTGVGSNASGTTGGAGGAGINGPTGFEPTIFPGDELCRGGGGSNSTSIGTYLETEGSGGPGGSQSGPGGQNGAVLIKTHP